MNPDPASLDALHDVVSPAGVSWWPLAPGWYIVAGFLILALAWSARTAWQRWQANAYRRAALRELGQLKDPSAVAELLRRVALVIAPRSTIASLSGPAWANWLSSWCEAAMPVEVRQLLSGGLYDRSTTDDLTALREYAAHWIRHHRRELPSAPTAN